MQSIERNTMHHISGGNQGFLEWLRQALTPSDPAEPDRRIPEEPNYNAQY